MSNAKLISEFSKFDDDKLRDILRQFNLSCSGRRNLLLNRLASAVRHGKISGFELPIIINSRSNSSESLAIGNVDFLIPPVPNSEESDFDLPEGFVPLHMREEVLNQLNNACDKNIFDEQMSGSLNGAIPKNSLSSQQLKPGYFPVLPLPENRVTQSKVLNSSFQAQADNSDNFQVVDNSNNLNNSRIDFNDQAFEITTNNFQANVAKNNSPQANVNNNNLQNSQAINNSHNFQNSQILRNSPNNFEVSFSHSQGQNMQAARHNNNRANQPNNFNRQNAVNQRNQDNSYAKTIEAMRKWNLKFSGTKAEDPESFLTRLNEGRAIVTISNDDFLRCLPFFLEGIALHWFRNEQDRWQTLADFVQAFRARFGPIDYQNALFFEIRNRTQGPLESVSDFITCMKSLMARSVPVIPAAQQIEIVSRNLLPQIQNGIDTSAIFDLADLERLARYRERRIAVSKEYKPPPPAAQALHADFAYQDPRFQSPRNFVRTRNFIPREPNRLANIEFSDDNEIDVTDSLNCDSEEFPFLTSYDDQEIQELANLRLDSRKQNFRSRNSGKPNMNFSLAALNSDSRFCFRCGSQDGHTSHNCTSPRRVFCRSCGKFGKTRNNCDNCPPLGEQAYCSNCGLTGFNAKSCPDCIKTGNVTQG